MKDHRLWVSSSKDEPPYPLIGEDHYRLLHAWLWFCSHFEGIHVLASTCSSGSSECPYCFMTFPGHFVLFSFVVSFQIIPAPVAKCAVLNFSNPSPRPGHEFPFSIKMSHVRDGGSGRGDPSSPCECPEVQLLDRCLPPDTQCHFILRPSKVTHSTDALAGEQ